MGVMNLGVIIILIALALTIAGASGCAYEEKKSNGFNVSNGTLTEMPEKDSCSMDSDCICGGKEISTGQCFVGNREYYESNVDKEAVCPDFCTGIAGNLKTKCVNNTCKTVVEK